MGGHKKINLRAMNKTDCLLTCVWSTFDAIEHESLLEGAYLVFDGNNARICR